VHGLTSSNGVLGGEGGDECCRSCDGEACAGRLAVSAVAKLCYIGVIMCCAVSILVLQDSYVLGVTPEIVCSVW